MAYGWMISSLLLITTLSAMDFHDFDGYQNRLSKKEVETKIQTYLENGANLGSFYQITKDALTIGDFARKNIDYTLYFRDESQQPEKKPVSKKSLQGAKIAIDPGHFGGDMAELEERCIRIPAEKTKDHQSISFDEGTLTYLTAIALQSLLEQEGAEVFITRSGIGQGAIELSFFEWLQNSSAFWGSKQPLSHIFRTHYNNADLIARAQKINAYHPDITIIIHYNTHTSDIEKERGSPFTDANYNLAFIPGAFSSGEMQKREDRYEFLRLLVTDDIEESERLSRAVIHQFTSHLSVPPVSNSAQNSYMHRFCLFQEPGIYARNLALTRRIHSPLCYGESLIQNNEEEVYRLALCDTEIAGHPCSHRLPAVAQAYFEAIKDYFKKCE